MLKFNKNQNIRKISTRYNYFMFTDAHLDLCVESDLKIINFIDHIYDTIDDAKFNYFQLKNKFEKKKEHYFLCFIFYLRFQTIKNRLCLKYDLFEELFTKISYNNEKMEKNVITFHANDFEMFINRLTDNQFFSTEDNLFKKKKWYEKLEFKEKLYYDMFNISGIDKDVYKKMKNLEGMINIIKKNYGILSTTNSKEINFLKLVKIVVEFGDIDLSNIKNEKNEKSKINEREINYSLWEGNHHYYDEKIYLNDKSEWKRNGITFLTKIDSVKFAKDLLYMQNIKEIKKLFSEKKEKINRKDDEMTKYFYENDPDLLTSDVNTIINAADNNNSISKEIFEKFMKCLDFVFEVFNKLMKLKFERDYTCEKIIYKHEISIHKAALYLMIFSFLKEKKEEKKEEKEETISEENIIERIYCKNVEHPIDKSHHDLSVLIKKILEIWI